MKIPATNGEVYYDYTNGNPAEQRAALAEMARRVNTTKEFQFDLYAMDPEYRNQIEEKTVRYFKTYKLNGAQDQRW